MNKKYLLRLIICLLLVSAAVGGGLFTGLFESAGQVFGSLHLNAAVLVQVAVMAFLVLGLENLLVLILGLLHFKSGRTNTLLTIVSSVVRYASAIVIVCWGLYILGVDVSTIVASVGIIALIIGFGAESLIADMITGLFMIFENQYNVGDIVEVGGFRGTVTSIGIRTTALTDAGGNIKIINNSNRKDILNRSNIVSKSIAEIGVPYELDLEAFEEKIPAILEEIYRKHPDMMKSVPTYLGVSALGSSAVMLKFCVEVSEPDIFKGQRVLNHDLYCGFKKVGVEVPYDQLTIHNKS